MAEAQWWTQLSLDEQLDYLREHPKSEFTVRAQPYPPEALRGVAAQLGTPALADELKPAVDNAESQVDARFKPEEQRAFGAAIRRAWQSPNVRARRRAITQFALKSGLVLLTSATLTVATGVPSSFFVPMLVSFNWNDLPDIRDPREMFKQFSKMFFDGVRNAMLHKALMGGALRAEKGSPAVRTEQAVAIRSNHESDLNKTLTRLETAAVAPALHSDPCVAAAQVLQRTAWLEQNIPVLGNVVVIASPQRLSLGNRANRLLSAYTAELAACYEAARALAVQPVNRPLQTVLKQHMQRDPVRASGVVARTAFGVAAEYSAFEFDHPRGRVHFVGRRDGDAVEIAYSVDSLFAPRHFYRMRARDLKAWLRNNIEVVA